MIQYFTEGIAHITDFEGYDHMLYLAALCAPFALKQWKKVVLLATAFTAGHSIALILSALDILRFRSDLIETLIPATIMATALLNILKKSTSNPNSILPYIITILFGLIHGMGFSTYFRIIADDGTDFVMSLLLFNLGVETGQLIIISVLLTASTLLTNTLNLISQKRYVMALSIAAFGVALWLFIGKIIGE
jgi:uncharacterized membrane-anchored protein YitT (DUF2179 family)